MAFVRFYLERTFYFLSPVRFPLRVKAAGERQMEITMVTDRADRETRLGFWPVIHPSGRQG